MARVGRGLPTGLLRQPRVIGVCERREASGRGRGRVDGVVECCGFAEPRKGVGVGVDGYARDGALERERGGRQGRGGGPLDLATRKRLGGEQEAKQRRQGWRGSEFVVREGYAY